jgi:hypothetical protein
MIFDPVIFAPIIRPTIIRHSPNYETAWPILNFTR